MNYKHYIIILLLHLYLFIDILIVGKEIQFYNKDT